MLPDCALITKGACVTTPKSKSDRGGRVKIVRDEGAGSGDPATSEETIKMPAGGWATESERTQVDADDPQASEVTDKSAAPEPVELGEPAAEPDSVPVVTEESIKFAVDASALSPEPPAPADAKGARREHMDVEWEFDLGSLPDVSADDLADIDDDDEGDEATMPGVPLPVLKPD